MITVVLPAYNEEENIAPAAKAVGDVLKGCGEEYEILFVSDGSSDGTFDKVREIHAKDPNVTGVEFSRNFGKEAAIFAGLSAAKGDAVIVMDCDLQHPPAVIPEMVEKWRAGAEVVEGVKSSRGKESLWYKLSAGLFYKIMSGLIHMDMNASSDFKLLDRKVVDTLLTLPERNTFFRALSFWVGFRTEKVFYEVQERTLGKSKWSTRKLIAYAIRNATSFSTLPLQVVTFMGWVFLVFSLILGIQTLVRYLLGQSVEGFTTVILLILVVGGFLMLSLGIIGHYIARIYEEVKGRPRYIIRRTTDEERKNG